MGWKNLTFILIPHSKSHIKQYTVKRAVLIAVAAVLVFLTGVMIFYIIGFQRKSFLLSSSREIKKQNEILETVVSELDSSITILTERVDSLQSVAEETRREANISDRDLKLNEENNLISADELQFSLLKRLDDINRLERRSYAFSYNYANVYEKCIADTVFLRGLPSIRPASGFISKDFTWLDRNEEITLMEKSHPGVSITNIEGTPIFATADGVIAKIGTSDDLGRYIEIDHENGYRTRYTNLQSVPQMDDKIRLNEGDHVIRGQQIATMGRTGISIQAIAPHLMYTIEHNGTYVNPNDYFFASDDSTLIPLGILLAQQQ
jgi:murein DD-endopeptidase MepM/ murein hydrolase activator NlpD